MGQIYEAVVAPSIFQPSQYGVKRCAMCVQPATLMPHVRTSQMALVKSVTANTALLEMGYTSVKVRRKQHFSWFQLYVH